MRLRHSKSITRAGHPGHVCKVTALCWTPNGQKLAICTTDRTVLIFDANGNKRDKFTTKANEKVCSIFFYDFPDSFQFSLHLNLQFHIVTLDFVLLSTGL